MISLIISLFASMSHTISSMLHNNQEQKKIAAKPIASTPSKSVYVKTNNNPITVIKPGTLAAIKESQIAAESNIMNTTNNSAMAASLKATESEEAEEEAPSDLSQYDNYAKNISALKRQIELNKLKSELYKSSIDYEDPGSYDQATMIGVVVDPHGYKSARIKLADDTTTELMVGSRFGSYIVSAININEITLISPKCKTHKHPSKKPQPKHVNHNTANQPNQAEEENPLICKPVKIYPLYRDLNNRLSVGNGGAKTVGPASTGGARVYNGTPSTTNAMLNAGGAAGSGGTSISSGGMNLTIPPIETGPHGN